MKYWKVWKQLTNCAVSSYLSNRIDSASYFIGKIIRFGFFILLIFSIYRFTDNIAGYSKYQALLFFLTYNLLDVASQAFFRGIYMFKDDVKRGDFDFALIRPVNPLFYTMTKIMDILDFIFLAIIIGAIIYSVIKLHVAITAVNLILYFILLFLGLLIITGIHILSASFTIKTVENENLIWLYRNTIAAGRFPPDIYSPAFQFIFTFILPVIIIVGFPVKAFLGILSWPWIIFACVYAVAFFALSVLLWKWSLKKYSSASS
jgi:ABC-2 type transport system permease protein